MTGPQQNGMGRRAGFTLVELLVVTGVVLVLMTLAVAFVPRTMEQQRVSRAASQLQGWLALSRQWALRDQAPRGLRLTFARPTNPANPSDPTFYRVTTLQYIEQPDDWRPGGNAVITTTGTGGGAVQWVSSSSPGTVMSGTTLNLIPPTVTPNFSGGFSAAFPAWDPLAPIQGGDFLEIGGGSAARLGRIVNDPNATNTSGMPTPIVPTPTSVTVNITGLGALTTSDFRVVRGARVRTGEAPLQLPEDTAIDVFTNKPNIYNSPLPASSNTPNSVDILFNPFGGVVTNGVPGNDLHLWVVDTSVNGPYQFTFQPSPGGPIPIDPAPPVFDGQQLLVTIGLRSGFVSVQPPDTFIPPGGSWYTRPYSYTQDGKTSGF